MIQDITFYPSYTYPDPILGTVIKLDSFLLRACPLTSIYTWGYITTKVIVKNVFMRVLTNSIDPVKMYRLGKTIFVVSLYIYFL